MNKMTIFIDCEFNDFQGELISIALVANDGQEFYRSLGCNDPSPWVATHVMPVIGVTPMAKEVIQAQLQAFLMQYRAGIHVVADWPEDIAHFCQLLICGPGVRINTPPLTMEVRRDLDSISEIPHNALSDARAIWNKYVELTHEG